jgi:hypothetical protein
MTTSKDDGSRLRCPLRRPRLHLRLRHRPPFLIVESLSISKPLDAMADTKMSNSLFARGCFVRMYVGYRRLRKIWEMSAKADTNCHDIFNIVSATWTHWAKIGATCSCRADMSRHVGDISSYRCHHHPPLQRHCRPHPPDPPAQ